jgi:RNA polymerase sigma-70 factor, ECF subfamily
VTTATGTRDMTDWSSIVHEHGPLVWRTAFRLLNREADAADCFQQTFLSAVEFAERQPVRDWPALLRRLSTARAIEQLRLRYRSSARNALLTDAEVDPSALDPLAHAAGGELADRLRESLAAIDPRQAAAFCLTALDGLSNAEAGEAMGVSANHVGVLVYRARQALRGRLIGFDPKVPR